MPDPVAASPSSEALRALFGTGADRAGFEARIARVTERLVAARGWDDALAIAAREGGRRAAQRRRRSARQRPGPRARRGARRAQRA